MDLAVGRPSLAGRNQRVRRGPVPAMGERHGSGAEFSAAATRLDRITSFAAIYSPSERSTRSCPRIDLFVQVPEDEFMIKKVLPRLPSRRVRVPAL
jgi:hypothetical protein